MRMQTIIAELRLHAPFTAMGTATGIAIMLTVLFLRLSEGTSAALFWTFHPIHVLLSALVTTAMYRLHGGKSIWRTLLIGYFGSVGIATLSDSIIPFIAEWMLDLPNRGIHLGVIEKWWLVNPLALAGIAIACRYPKTKVSHAAHVLLSTWASLFHMTMALGSDVSLWVILPVTFFLFVAVWAPCCTSDIIFPLLFSKEHDGAREDTTHAAVDKGG